MPSPCVHYSLDLSCSSWSPGFSDFAFFCALLLSSAGQVNKPAWFHQCDSVILIRSDPDGISLFSCCDPSWPPHRIGSRWWYGPSACTWKKCVMPASANSPENSLFAPHKDLRLCFVSSCSPTFCQTSSVLFVHENVSRCCSAYAHTGLFMQAAINSHLHFH